MLAGHIDYSPSLPPCRSANSISIPLYLVGRVSHTLHAPGSPEMPGRLVEISSLWGPLCVGVVCSSAQWSLPSPIFHQFAPFLVVLAAHKCGALRIKNRVEVCALVTVGVCALP